MSELYTCEHKKEIKEWDFPHKIVLWCEECRMKTIYKELNVSSTKVEYHPEQTMDVVRVNGKLRI